MFDLKEYLEDRRTLFLNRLSRILDIRSSGSGRLLDSMKYSLNAGGKRLRPILCLAAAEAVGGQPENCLTAACALEMIHTYSLIHDDLPAMDNDDLRRGHPTCHIKFDEATAVLAGDALLTMAFNILASEENSDTNNPVIKLSVIEIISRAAGQPGMIEGQMTDIESEGKALEFDALAKMHDLKTGALITASILSGAILGGGSKKEIEKLENYSKYIGLAFQVADDILNVTGDPELMGKATGTDHELNKATYPSLLGLEESQKFAVELIEKSLNELNDFGHDAEPLRAIAGYIIKRNR